MRNIIFGLLVLSLGFSAQAKRLECVSAGEEDLYFTTSKITLKADIVAENSSEVKLENLDLEADYGFLGSRDESVQGELRDKYVRFSLYGDHLCSYRITFDKGFESKKRTIVFVDAFCEEGFKYEIKLFCSVN